MQQLLEVQLALQLLLLLLLQQLVRQNLQQVLHQVLLLLLVHQNQMALLLVDQLHQVQPQRLMNCREQT
jgi:hypothetical protein